MSAKPRFLHTVIRASAGTGKTYQLSNRFIGLLASGARPDEILATTFTRKAAGEILDRVLLRLAEAANDGTKHAELAKAIGDQNLTQERCRELLVSTVHSLHRLRVGTLDSYFIQVASSFALELGLPPGWSIGEELDDALLRDEAVELVLSRGRLSDLLTLVHSLTKGATQRGVGQLVHDTVGGLFELFRETSPAAWQQLPRLKELPAEEFERVLDALASFELPTAQLASTRSKDVEKSRLGQWDELLKSGIGAKIHTGETTFNRKPLPAELVGFYRLLLKQAEAVLVGQIARQTEATHDLLARFAEHYYALQHDERMLRFSDVTQRLSLASGIASPAQMAFRLDAGLQHLLLDEFQDTSPMQWRVLRPLAQAVAARKGGSFFCVGDAKQAIYGWRGGVAAIFGALDGELPGLTHSGLDTSYRSSQPVIDTVNQVFQNLTKHPNLDRFAAAVAEWQQQFPPHKTAQSDRPGCVTLTTAPDPTVDQDAAEVLFDHAAERIAAAIKEAPAASIGVLVRTNKAVAHLIYLLRKRDILASEEGGNPLSDSPAVELILSLLKLADHPGDSVARFHLATSPLAAPLELTDYQDDRTAARISQNLRRQLLDDGYGATIHAWARNLATSCDRRDLSRLQQLVELAYDYQPRSTLRADQFIALVQSKRIADPAASSVRVMTIHQAKGLEFDIVFLPELGGKFYGQRGEYVAGRPSPTQPFDLVCRSANENVRQFFPPRLAKLFDDDTKDEVTESLCVLYVAMTRAAHALHMILPPAKENEKSLPKTYAGLLRAALAPGQPATGGLTLYEHGHPTWFAKLSLPLGEGRGEGVNIALNSPPPIIQLAKPLKTKSRNLERTSPSALEGGSRLRASRLLEPRPDDAFGLGTLIHAWLAEIEWLDDGQPSDDRLRMVAARLRPEIGPLADNLDLPLSNFRRWLTAPAIQKALSRSFYNDPKNLGLPALKSNAWKPGEFEFEVLREHPFAIRDGDEILSGAIDRLVLIKHSGQLLAADILDFKTDELPASDPATLAARTDFYRPQMEAYRRATTQLLKLDTSRVTARLVFLAPNLVAMANGS